MKHLKWSDNIRTVGWTCIHGHFSFNDLCWLCQMHPRGTITPTFYNPELSSWYTREDVIAKADERHLPYYFNFPEDEKGKQLLVALKLRGLGDRIK